MLALDFLEQADTSAWSPRRNAEGARDAANERREADIDWMSKSEAEKEAAIKESDMQLKKLEKLRARIAERKREMARLFLEERKKNKTLGKGGKRVKRRKTRRHRR